MGTRYIHSTFGPCGQLLAIGRQYEAESIGLAPPFTQRGFFALLEFCFDLLDLSFQLRDTLFHLFETPDEIATVHFCERTCRNEPKQICCMDLRAFAYAMSAICNGSPSPITSRVRAQQSNDKKK